MLGSSLFHTLVGRPVSVAAMAKVAFLVVSHRNQVNHGRVVRASRGHQLRVCVVHPCNFLRHTFGQLVQRRKGRHWLGIITENVNCFVFPDIYFVCALNRWVFGVSGREQFKVFDGARKMLALPVIFFGDQATLELAKVNCRSVGLLYTDERLVERDLVLRLLAERRGLLVCLRVVGCLTNGWLRALEIALLVSSGVWQLVGLELYGGFGLPWSGYV